jgi:hypothetical protein
MMTKKIFVKPASGMLVRDPYTLKALDIEGEWKPQETYWIRRVACGDCLEVVAPSIAVVVEVPVAEEQQPQWVSSHIKKSRKTQDNEKPNDGRGDS